MNFNTQQNYNEIEVVHVSNKEIQCLNFKLIVFQILYRVLIAPYNTIEYNGHGKW